MRQPFVHLTELLDFWHKVLHSKAEPVTTRRPVLEKHGVKLSTFSASKCTNFSADVLGYMERDDLL